jgi:hypothetical protein
MKGRDHKTFWYRFAKCEPKIYLSYFSGRVADQETNSGRTFVDEATFWPLFREVHPRKGSLYEG